MVHLAELNSNKVCIGVKTVKSMIHDGKHVEITEPDYEHYTFRKYENGQWSQEKYVPDHAQIELDRMEKLEQDNAMLKMQLKWLNDDLIFLMENL